ncbi:MAG: VTT domain-containing protein [Pirellulaceae bacterium]
MQRFLRRLLFSPTLYVIIVLLVAGWILMQFVASKNLSELRTNYGPAAMAMTLPMHIVMALTPFPSDLFSIANGALYGLTVGTLLSWVGWWIAALLQYALGRRARQDFELDQRSDRLPRFLRDLPIDHPLYLICIRQVPWLGMHIGSFVPGAAGVPWKRFLWCSAIGTFPGSLVMTAIGAGIVQLA